MFGLLPFELLEKAEKKWGEMRAERAERAGATGSFIHQLPFVVYSR